MLNGKGKRPQKPRAIEPPADDRYDAVALASPRCESAEAEVLAEKVDEDHTPRLLSTVSSQETLKYTLSPKYEEDGAAERGALRYANTPRTGTQTSADDRIIHRGNKGKIILITLVTAGIPLLLGSIFFASLGLNVPSGRYEGGYFIRSKDETVSLYVGTELFNPLLLASVISTIISIIPPFCLSLVAFHLGHQWIKASGLHGPGRNSKLMTPYQHSLLLSIGAMASEWSLLDFMRYWLFRTPSRRPNFIRRSTRAVIPTPLATGAISLFIVLFLSYFIKVVDIMLHKEITSTVIFQAQRNGTYESSFGLKPECVNHESPGCPIADRSTLGFQAAANLSDVFRAYPMGNSSNLPNLAIMALPPSTDTAWDYNAATIGVSATCEARRPICSVEDQEVRACWPLNAPDEDMFFATVQDQALTPDIQLFQAPYEGGKAFNGPSIGGTGARSSPNRLFGWSCFPNYGNVTYSDTNASFPTPFVNWHMIGQGISPNVLLCSVLACDIDIHEVLYTMRNGTLGVLGDTAQRADNATILTVTDVLPYSTYQQTAQNGEKFVDSMIYRYTRKLIDAQLQTAITSAGNMVGNDTIAFQNQVAQSISNLLVSWAAGAVEAGPSLSAARNAPLLAVKIPLSWSFLFIACLYLFALLIVLLGISCLLLPTVYTKTDETVVKHGQSYRVAVPEIDIARLRFVDISTIVHELIPQDGRSARLDGAEMFQEGSGRDYDANSDRLSKYSINSALIPEAVILRRKKSRAEKELKTVLVHEDDEMRLKIEGR